MEAHPYHLTLQASGLYGLAVYSPVLDEIVDVPPEFLDYELARIGELLNTPPLMNSREDVVNGSMPSNASRNSSSSTSLPSSDRPVPLSSPSSDPLSSSDKWTISRAAIRLAPVREAPKASRSPKAVKLGDGKESKWERREVACLGCRTRKCRVSTQQRMGCTINDTDVNSAKVHIPMVDAIDAQQKVSNVCSNPFRKPRRLGLLERLVSRGQRNGRGRFDLPPMPSILDLHPWPLCQQQHLFLPCPRYKARSTTLEPLSTNNLSTTRWHTRFC